MTKKAGGDARIAILMQMTGVSAEEAHHLLEQARGKIRDMIEQTQDDHPYKNPLPFQERIFFFHSRSVPTRERAS